MSSPTFRHIARSAARQQEFCMLTASNTAASCWPTGGARRDRSNLVRRAVRFGDPRIVGVS